MQRTAQGWLVYQITGSKFMLGLVGMISMLPLALFSPVGGFIADRFSRRNVLVATQSLSMVPPLILAALVLTGTVEIWHIAVLAGLLGSIMAIDIPARQAFVIDMVGRGDLMNAIGLNSGIFNGARIFGPAVAGVMMAAVGIGFCFLINGLSFIAVVIGLLMIRLPSRVANASMIEDRAGASRLGGALRSFYRHTAAGFSYVKSEPQLLGLLGLVAIAGVFGFPYMRLLPAFAQDIFKVEELGYSYLLTLNGIGALAGALTVATLAKYKRRKRVLFTGVFLFCGGVIAFSFCGSFRVSLIPLALAGLGMTAFFSTANTMVQTTVPDEYRGRVMGMWTFAFGAAMPIGSILAGTVAQQIGAPLTVRIGAAVCAVAGIAALIISRKYRAPKEFEELPPADELYSPY